MKLDLVSRKLYTDSGEFIKRVSCPYNMKWDDMEKTNSPNRNCSECKINILDTEFLSDMDLLDLVNTSPNICLKINLNQDNIQLISNGERQQK